MGYNETALGQVSFSVSGKPLTGSISRTDYAVHIVIIRRALRRGRVAPPRVYLNLMITFFVSGVWHGAGWTFVAWGLLHGAYQCYEGGAGEVADTPPVRVVVTFCLVTLAWVFFRAGSMGEALGVFRGIARLPQELLSFADLKNSLGLKEAVKISLPLSEIGGFKEIAKAIFFILIFTFISFVTRKRPGLEIIRERPIALRFAMYFALTAMIVFFQINAYSNNFIYQNF